MLINKFVDHWSYISQIKYYTSKPKPIKKPMWTQDTRFHILQSIIWAVSWENRLSAYAKTAQLINAFVFATTIPQLPKSEIPSF